MKVERQILRPATPSRAFKTQTSEASSVDTFQSSFEEQGTADFYAGLGAAGEFSTKLSGAVGGAAVATAVGVAAALSLGAMSTALVVGTGIGAVALGVAGYLVGDAASDAVGDLGRQLDKRHPERGEAIARTGLMAGLSAITGGLSAAGTVAAFCFGEGVLNECWHKVKDRLRS